MSHSSLEASQGATVGGDTATITFREWRAWMLAGCRWCFTKKRSTRIYINSVEVARLTLFGFGLIQLAPFKIIWVVCSRFWFGLWFMLKDHTPLLEGLSIWGDWHPYEFTIIWRWSTILQDCSLVPRENAAQDAVRRFHGGQLNVGSSQLTKNTRQMTVLCGFVWFEAFKLRIVPSRYTWKEMIHHPG